MNTNIIEQLTTYVLRVDPAKTHEQATTIARALAGCGFYALTDGHLRPSGPAVAYAEVCKLAPRVVDLVEREHVARVAPGVGGIELANHLLAARGSSLDAALGNSDEGFAMLGFGTDGGV